MHGQSSHEKSSSLLSVFYMVAMSLCCHHHHHLPLQLASQLASSYLLLLRGCCSLCLLDESDRAVGSSVIRTAASLSSIVTQSVFRWCTSNSTTAHAGRLCPSLCHALLTHCAHMPKLITLRRYQHTKKQCQQTTWHIRVFRKTFFSSGHIRLSFDRCGREDHARPPSHQSFRRIVVGILRQKKDSIVFFPTAANRDRRYVSILVRSLKQKQSFVLSSQTCQVDNSNNKMKFSAAVILASVGSAAAFSGS